MIGLKLQFPHGFCWETVLAMIECLHADFFSQKIQTKHPFIAIVKNSDLKMPSDGWAHEANRWTHQGLLGVGGIRIFTQCGGMRYRLLHEVVFSRKLLKNHWCHEEMPPLNIRKIHEMNLLRKDYV